MAIQQRKYQQTPNFEGHGPSWYDVHEMIEQVERLCELKIQLVTAQVTAVDGKKGLRVAVGVIGQQPEGFASGFGPAYPNSPKTFPAAAYSALLKLWEYLDELTPLELAIWIAERKEDRA